MVNDDEPSLDQHLTIANAIANDGYGWKMGPRWLLVAAGAIHGSQET